MNKKTDNLKHNQWKIITILIALLSLTILLTTAIGPVYISPTEIIQMIFPANLMEILRGRDLLAHERIILLVRLPRICLGIIVGAALSVAGAVMQGLFKNPMADPYIIGISSGAGFGAALCITFGIVFSYATPLMAFFGAIIAVFLVYDISRVVGKVPVNTLLLSGIAVGYFFSACTSFLIIKSENIHQIIFWLMGGLGGSIWNHVKTTFPLIFFGILILYFFSREMNVMLLGEESAQHLGIEVEKFKRIIMILASLITAAAVSVSGLIGSVDLMIPHIVRLLFGPDHRILIPSSALVGGIFLVWADTLARTIISPAELPVGVITAFFGAPFFIYLLRTKKRSVFG